MGLWGDLHVCIYACINILYSCMLIYIHDPHVLYRVIHIHKSLMFENVV